MSYINKPGKTSAWRQMTTRQQVSDVLTYHQISTTLTKAKITQKHVEHLITLAKVDNVANRRAASRILLNTKLFNKNELITYLFTKIAPKFKTRPGGYTRVIKKGPRRGDSAEEAVLQFVINVPKTQKSGSKKVKQAKSNAKIGKSKIASNEKEVKDHKDVHEHKSSVHSIATHKVESDKKGSKEHKTSHDHKASVHSNTNHKVTQHSHVGQKNDDSSERRNSSSGQQHKKNKV